MSAAFFQNFPPIRYTYASGREVTITNIFIYIKLREILQQALYLFVQYQIKDGEKSEDIAAKLYNNSQYWWVVLFSAQIVDPFYDWPLGSSEFIQWIIDSYGSIETAQNIIAYYIDSYGNQIDFQTYQSLPFNTVSAISVYENLYNLNEQKRNIFLLAPQYLGLVESQLIQLLQNAAT